MGLLPSALWYLGHFLAASSTAAGLTQPKATSASLRDTVRLPCTLSTDSITTYTILWFQHQHPSPPKYLLYYKDDASQKKRPGVSDRFSASKDASTSTCHLTIFRVQSKDEGAYFCVTSKGGEYVFGGGTHLTVLDPSRPHVAPTVHIFGPSEEERKSKGKATLACLMDGFYPEGITVEWLVDGTAVSSGVETTKPAKQGDKYVASSYLMYSASEWENHKNYVCKVTHGDRAVEKSLQRSECP